MWAGPLSKGRVALLLWNKSDKTDTINASWSDLGIENGTPVIVRDLWKVRLLHCCMHISKEFRKIFISHMMRFLILNGIEYAAPKCKGHWKRQNLSRGAFSWSRDVYHYSNKQIL